MKKNLPKKLFFSLLCSTYLLPTPAFASVFETPEYFKSAGLKYINASTAYDLGFTGKNILLGELDDGVLFRHQEFLGKTSLTLLPNDPNWDWNDNTHGTHVAGIMLANKDDREMHGVAFNANLFAGQGATDANVTAYYKATFSKPELKIINNSWGSNFYIQALNSATKDDFVNKSHNQSFFQIVKTAVLDHDKVFVFSAGNEGQMSPIFQAGVPYLLPELSGNWLNAMAFDPQKKTSDHGFVALFTNLAARVEENSLMAPGVNIYSSVSSNTSNNLYDNSSGTSMAAPFITGSLGLVQEAFPYMSGKQLVDTILSTTNKTFTTENFVVLYEDNTENNNEDGTPTPGSNRLNLIYFTAKPSDAQIDQDLRDYYAANKDMLREMYSLNDENSFLSFDRTIHENIPWESVYGQGLLDVGKAVQGPGLLNARRLSAADISSDYGNKQALYSINTQGYNSVWGNDISEKTVDQAYITHSERNDLADLIGLSVGLQKNGSGTLALLGKNTYRGASIVSGGTLQIDGSIAGDTYSNPQGILSGSGTLQNVFNRGTLQAGSWGQVGTMTIAGNLESSGNINVVIKDDIASMIKVNNSANIAGSSITPLRNKALTPNSKYEFLTANSFSGAFANQKLSAFLSSTGTIDGNSAYLNIDAAALNSLNNLTNNQYRTATLLENMYSNLSGKNTQRELDPLYNMSKEEAKTAFSEVYGGTQTQAVRLAPLNSGLGSSVFSRLDALPNSVNVNVPVKSLTAPTSADFYTSTIIPLEFDDKNSYWLKLIGGWEHINATSEFAGTKSNNFGFVMGTDYQANKNWRLGTMLAYGRANIYNALNNGKIHDYRLGIYGGYQKEAFEMQTYLSFGKQDYNISRSLSTLGKTAHSDYNALSLDLGLKAKYDLHHNDKKLWQVKPYLGLNLQSSWQDAYTETGAGIFSQQVDRFNNIYSTAGLGLEISRKINTHGQYGFAVGYKRVLSGNNPELNAHLIGDTSQNFRLSSIADSKNIFSVEINAEGKLKNNWSIFGQAVGEFTHKSKSGFVSVSLRHSW